MYKYIHFKTPFGTITVPTTGYYETEFCNCMGALRSYLQSKLSGTLSSDKRAKIEKFLSVNSAIQSSQVRTIGWSNEVSPKELGKNQIVKP